jgi:Ca2+:H+ antiporter
VTRRILWASTVLVPIDVLLALLGVGDTWLFIVSAAALVPLAFAIGEATDHVGEHTGPAVAGLLNASFGNAPELLISLFAVEAGLFDVVKASLAGSVISNLLLVLGTALIFGRRAKVSQRSVFANLGQVALAAVIFGVATLLAGGLGDDDPAAGSVGSGSVEWYAILLAAILLVLYLAVTTVNIRRAVRTHRAEGPDASDDAWSLRRGVLVLALATVATAVISRLLTGTIEQFSAQTGLGEFFSAAIIIAIVGNAAEHGGAVVVAARGNVELATEIGLSSSAQVATFVIPAVVLLSLGLNPMPMTFRPIEFIGYAAAVVVPAVLLGRGQASRGRGVVLAVTYGIVGVLFFIASR